MLKRNDWSTVPEIEVDELPEHVCDYLEGLRKFANGLAGYYGQPVWLVGSVLLPSNSRPRDWDIRVVLPNEDFEMRFGALGEWAHDGLTGKWHEARWRWADENVKRSREAWRTLRLPVDFQTMPVVSASAYRADMRFRLDTMPGELEEAIPDSGVFVLKREVG
jgi:hypothetical protein